MSMDKKRYYEVFERFLLRIEELKSLDEEEIKEVVQEMCEVLRISYFEMCLYPNPLKEQCNDGVVQVLYEKDGIDHQRLQRMREVIGNGEVRIYRVCQYLDEDDWTEEECSKIHVFMKMVFSFQGRINIMNMVEKLNHHDLELGIHNLTYFMRFTSMLIAQRRIDKYTACYFNLKHFSLVNQQYGRDVGTNIMRQFVQNLQDMLSEEEIIARVGGDNFIMLILDENMESVKRYLLGAEIVYEEEQVFISASQGYFSVPEDNSVRDASELVDCVTLAAKIAQDAANDDVVFFEDSMLKRKEQAKHIENIFPDAINNGEFQVFYQPKIQLTDYRLVGAEALCRWFHNGEMMSPADFIPVLEQGKEICILDFYMLDRVCQSLRTWIDEGKKVVQISVNFSRRHLSSADLLENIIRIVDKYEVPHEYIQIELTETLTDVEFKSLKNIVSGLQEAGISTSVDDFGIGYSSLNVIREIPWNVLKIDKSFLPTERNVNSSKYIMLKYVIAMAQSMGLECIVEGVETLEQVRMLKDNNCYLAQGFYFDRPLPKEEFERRIMA